MNWRARGDWKLYSKWLIRSSNLILLDPSCFCFMQFSWLEANMNVVCFSCLCKLHAAFSLNDYYALPFDEPLLPAASSKSSGVRYHYKTLIISSNLTHYFSCCCCFLQSSTINLPPHSHQSSQCNSLPLPLPTQTLQQPLSILPSTPSLSPTRSTIVFASIYKNEWASAHLPQKSHSSWRKKEVSSSHERTDLRSRTLS